GAPYPAPPRLAGNALVSRLFRHTLARNPSLAERTKANELLKEKAEGLEDLLWILFLSPYFNLIGGERLCKSKPAADISSTARPLSLRQRSSVAARISSG